MILLFSSTAAWSSSVCCGVRISAIREEQAFFHQRMLQSSSTNKEVTDFQSLSLWCVLPCWCWANRPRARRADSSPRNSHLPIGIKPCSILAKTAYILKLERNLYLLCSNYFFVPIKFLIFFLDRHNIQRYSYS